MSLILEYTDYWEAVVDLVEAVLAENELAERPLSASPPSLIVAS